MERYQELKAKIEVLRDELNQSIVEEQFEVYYEKSIALDKLIEEYIEIEDKIPA